jgi:uncharacterized protein involved in outer membrane biogenesis
VKFFSSKRRIAAVAVLVLLVLYFVRPGASRLKSRIISSLSAATGRSVDVGSVHLQLLPRPGFDLGNVVVYDDPTFGAEPILRASEVTADLRLTSLLRGRLEIARLELTEPSLNLVHNDAGRWNLEALLEHSAHTPMAPTAKTRSERRPGFPYIEGSSARINFKSGAEKKPYSLTNADFSLWQDSENSWGVRLKAQPVRTDLNLSDTGLLQMNGTWQRAERFHDTPLQFNLEWMRAQLGQVTKFFTGNDKGWRGAIQLDVAMTGTPANLQITSTASIDDFRRYDLASMRALRLAANCDGTYSSLIHEFREVKCSAPVGKGSITLTGNVGFPGSRRFAIAMTAENVPANAISALAQRAKKNLPDDLAVEGLLNGKISMSKDVDATSALQFDGRGEIADFRLSSKTTGAEIARQDVPFVMVSNNAKGILHNHAISLARSGMRATQGPYVEFGPIALDVGIAGGTVARGWISRMGYSLNVTGETEIVKLLRISPTIGLPAMAARPEGSAQVDLQVAGAWTGQPTANASGFAGAQVAGTAKLRNVKIAIHGAAGPVEIASADVQLLPDKARIVKLNAMAAGAVWTGSLELPRGCGSLENCPVHFALNTDDIALGQINEWANPSPKKRAWYQVLEGNRPTGPSLLSRLHATGTITADHLRMGNLEATRVWSWVILDHGTLAIPQVNANFLGGKHQGMWAADFNSKTALCNGSGKLTGASLTRLAAAMKDAWIAGTGTANYQVKGPCSAEFWRSAEGTLRVDVKDGTLPHILLGDDQEPLQFTQLVGQAELDAGKIEIDDATLDSADGKYQISGTATLQRELAIQMTHVSGGINTGYAISGTLDAPLVTPLTRTEQARLKR